MTTVRSIVVLLLLVCVHAVSAQEAIRISTGEFAPWSSQTLKYNGFTNRVISEAFKLESSAYYPGLIAVEHRWRQQEGQADEDDRDGVARPAIQV